jgi:hypothetical protein
MIGDPDPFQPLAQEQTGDEDSHGIDKDGEGIKNKMHGSASADFIIRFWTERCQA